MANIGLIIRPQVEAAQSLGQELVLWVKKNGHKLLLEEGTAQALSSSEGISAAQLVNQADPVVSLGGDGTLIGLARHVHEKCPVLLGVNFGRLGFLTEIAPNELFGVLPLVLEGKAKLGERSMLQVQVERANKTIFSSQAINDVVVQKSVEEKLLDLDVAVNDEPVMRLRADGLIIATPTGSTAYSLAAGGSIAYPGLSVVLITPICAHSLTNRPLILPLDATITVTVPEYDGKVVLSVDGQVSLPLQVGDKVITTKAKSLVKFVKSPTKSYFDILRSKLNWGLVNHEETGTP